MSNLRKPTPKFGAQPAKIRAGDRVRCDHRRGIGTVKSVGPAGIALVLWDFFHLQYDKASDLKVVS
jgi:hypothetical protein